MVKSLLSAARLNDDCVPPGAQSQTESLSTDPACVIDVELDVVSTSLSLHGTMCDLTRRHGLPMASRALTSSIRVKFMQFIPTAGVALLTVSIIGGLVRTLAGGSSVYEPLADRPAAVARAISDRCITVTRTVWAIVEVAHDPTRYL
jgi:hypothetical protein